RLTQVIGLFIGGLPDGPRRWVQAWLPAVLRAEPDHAGPEADAGEPRGIRAAPGERDPAWRPDGPPGLGRRVELSTEGRCAGRPLKGTSCVPARAHVSDTY